MKKLLLAIALLITFVGFSQSYYNETDILNKVFYSPNSSLMARYKTASDVFNLVYNPTAHALNFKLTGTIPASVIDWGAVVTGTNTYYVDKLGSDVTGNGTYYMPYATVRKAMEVINARSVTMAAGGNYNETKFLLKVAPGTYSDSVVFGNEKYLRVEMAGVNISGAVYINTSQQGGDYYSKLEFWGGMSNRSEKGDNGEISGLITATRNNDALQYLTFSGMEISNSLYLRTSGTWVVYLDHSYFSGSSKFISGLFTQGVAPTVLLETTNNSRIKAHIANPDGSKTNVSLYDVNQTEFDLINIHPINGSLIRNCTFMSNVTIDTLTHKLDNVSYGQILAQTETLTGATLNCLDCTFPGKVNILNGNRLVIKDTTNTDSLYIQNNGSTTYFGSTTPIVTNANFWTTGTLTANGAATLTDRLDVTGNAVFNGDSTKVLNQLVARKSTSGVGNFKVSFTPLGKPLMSLYSASGTNIMTNDSLNNVLIGIQSPPTSTATPTQIMLGSTYMNAANTPSKCKLLIYNDGTLYSGIGQTMNMMEFHTFAGSGFNFYSYGYLRLSVSSTGIVGNILGITAGGIAQTWKIIASANNIAGYNLIISGGDNTAGGTADLNGGMLQNNPGLSKGTGFASYRIGRNSRAASTGTVLNTISDAVIVPSENNMVDNVDKNLFEVALPTDAGSGGEIAYTIVATDGDTTDVRTGKVLYSLADGNATVLTNITESDGSAINVPAALTDMVVTWTATPSGGTKVIISAKTDISFQATSIKINYTITNNGTTAITQL